MTLGGFDVEGFQCVLGSEIALVVDNSVIAIYDRGGSLQPRSSFGLFDREKIESTQVVLHFFLFLLIDLKPQSLHNPSFLLSVNISDK